MKLRAHHLLCIQKFTGHGYNAAITTHLSVICEALQQSPESDVLLIDRCDELCEACPHRIGELCDSAEKVAALDAAVCEVCGLRTELVYSWAKLREISRAAILQTEQFHAICSRCQWYALCRLSEVL